MKLMSILQELKTQIVPQNWIDATFEATRRYNSPGRSSDWEYEFRQILSKHNINNQKSYFEWYSKSSLNGSLNKLLQNNRDKWLQELRTLSPKVQLIVGKRYDIFTNDIYSYEDNPPEWHIGYVYKGTVDYSTDYPKEPYDLFESGDYSFEFRVSEVNQMIKDGHIRYSQNLEELKTFIDRRKLVYQHPEENNLYLFQTENDELYGRYHPEEDYYGITLNSNEDSEVEIQEELNKYKIPFKIENDGDFEDGRMYYYTQFIIEDASKYFKFTK